MAKTQTVVQVKAVGTETTYILNTGSFLVERPDFIKCFNRHGLGLARSGIFAPAIREAVAAYKRRK